MNISELFESIELHDSQIVDIRISNTGKLDVYLNIDKEWNKNLASNIVGFSFKKIFEILEYKLDNFSVVGGVSIIDENEIDVSFVVNENQPTINGKIVEIDFVCGGKLGFTCTDEVEFLTKSS